MRLYIAVFPDCLITGYERAFPLLEELTIDHRHARDPKVLERYSDECWWTGKGIAADLPVDDQFEPAVRRLDALLEGQGLSGPPVLNGAQTLGGRSGLLFLRRPTPSAGGAAGTDGRRQRLAQLLSR